MDGPVYDELHNTEVAMSASPAAKAHVTLTAIESYLLWTGDWAEGSSTVDERVFERRGSTAQLRLPLNTPPESVDQAILTLIGDIAAVESRDEAAVERDVKQFNRLLPMLSNQYDKIVEGGGDPKFSNEPGKVKEIICKASTWVVYLDKDEDVIWQAADDYGAFPEDSGAVLNRLAILQAERVDQLDKKVKTAFRRMLGEGVARLLDDKRSQHALEIFDKAETYLQARYAEIARRCYLIAGLVVLVPVLVVAVIIWCCRAWIDSSISPAFAEFSLMACVGSIGAFLSVFYRLTGIKLDARAGNCLLYLEGALRIVVGMMGALLAAWAVKSGVLLSFAESGGLIPQMLFCAVSGASERMIPTMISAVEKAVTQKDNAQIEGALPRTQSLDHSLSRPAGTQPAPQAPPPTRNPLGGNPPSPT